MSTARGSDLEARVEVLEREVEGEKMVTRHILEQTRRNSDDLAALKTRMTRVEDKVDGLGGQVDALTADVRGLKADVHGLRQEMPRIVADTMREVLAERDRKR